MALKFKQGDLPKQVRAVIKDDDGTETTIENAHWTSGNGQLFQIGDVSPDGKTVTLLPGADPHATGLTTLTLDGDADLGAGSEPISNSVDVEITPDNAATIEFEVV